MKKKSFIIIFSFVLFFLSSCASKKKLDYLQNIESVALEASIKNAKSTIQPNDQLVILVTAKDMDVVKHFNQDRKSTRLNSSHLKLYRMPSYA